MVAWWEPVYEYESIMIMSPSKGKHTSSHIWLKVAFIFTVYSPLKPFFYRERIKGDEDLSMNALLNLYFNLDNS